MDKMSEKELVAQVKKFLEERGYVNSAKCHFGEDDDELPDVKLALNPERWPEKFPDYLLLEAKSHHSTDSPNTINKIFGQLLKESGKGMEDKLEGATFCLGLIIPEDPGSWTVDGGKKVYNRSSGIDYYQKGFRRIPAAKYQSFGELVDARYVLAYSHVNQWIKVFDWNDFYHCKAPICVLDNP